MAKEGGLGKDDRPWKEKLQYEAFMKCDPKFKTFVYTAPAEQKKEPQTDDQLLSPEQSQRNLGANTAAGSAGDPEGDIQMGDIESQKKDMDEINKEGGL